MKIITASVILVSFFLNAFSQEFATRLYTPKDGLVQAEVYCVTQGPKGYLWIGTLGGISRFDGLEFKNYTEQDGLISNSVYQMQWFNDTLFILTKEGVDIMVEGKFTNLFHDKNINFMMGHIKIMPGYRYAIGHNYDYYFFLDLKSGIITHFPHKLQYQENMIVSMTDTSFIVGKDSSLYEIPFGDNVYTKIAKFNNKVGRIRYFNKTIFVVFDFRTRKKINQVYVKLIRKNDDSGYNILYNEIKAPADYNLIDRIFYFNSGDLFFSSSDGYLFYDDNGRIIKYSDNYNYVLKAFEDNNGNIWFATEKGLLKLFMDKFIYLRPENGYTDNVWALSAINDSLLLLAGYNNGIHIYENGKEKEYLNTAKNILACYFNTCRGFKDDILVSVYPGVARYDIKNNQLSLITENLESNNFSLIKDKKNNRVLVASLRSLVAINSDYSTQKLFDMSSLGSKRFIKALCLRDNKVILGLARGLVEFDPATNKARYLLNDRTRIDALVIDSANTIWAATNNGLLKILEDTLYFIDNPKIPKNLTAIIINDNNMLYFTSQTKLFKLDLTKYYKGEKGQLTYYGQYDGYYGENAQENAFFKDDKGNLWIPTGYNIIKIVSNELENKNYFSNTLITNMSVSKGDTVFIPVNLSQDIKIEPAFNNIVINFLNINLQNPERTKYQCILSNGNRNWKSFTKNRMISFNNLPYGNYTFSVKASVTDDFEKSQTQVVHFTILPHFWQKTWFLFVSGLIFIVIIIMLLWYVKKREQKKNKGKMEVLKLKNLALTNQMDNHFIVNCTNKIALLFEAGKITEGNKYTRTFSRFLQQNLVFLRKETITLEDELNLIKNYVDLEKIHGRDFTFQIIVNPVVHPGEINIPPFLIQPIVENAIKHGVKMLPAGEGKILITVEQQDDGTIITVQDNGPGMNNINRKKSDGNRLSMKIVDERIRLMGKNSFVKFVSTNKGTNVTITLINN